MSSNLTSSIVDGNNTRLFQLLSSKYLRVPVEEIPNDVPGGVKVSVCVPTYQHIQTIDMCLKSILEQETSFTYEILIGEDESSDGTRERCLEYARKYSTKVRLFLQSRLNNISINGYPTGRLNMLYLFGKANGELIAICEGDDRWTDKNKLRMQVEALHDYPECNICCHPAYAESKYYSRHGGVIGYHGELQKIIAASETILPGGGFCATLSLMFRRKVINNLPEWLIDAPVMDFYLLVLASMPNGCLYIPKTIGVYGNSETGESWTSRLATNPRFAVAAEMSFLEHLDKLADHMDDTNRRALEQLRKIRKAWLLFVQHLPRNFRTSLYQETKRTLDLKFRLAWYLSACGRNPNLPLRIYWFLKDKLGVRIQ